MPIDVATEELLTLRQAAKALPPSNRTGRPLHISALWRWYKSGILAPNGTRVRLEVVRVGGTLATSVEALQRFIQRTSRTAAPQTESPGHTTLSNDRKRRLRAAEHELDIAGI